MYRNAILSMVFLAETSRTNNIITKLYFHSSVLCTVAYFMLFRSFYPWSAQVWKPSYPPFLKGQQFNMSGEGLLKILRKKNPIWPGKKGKMIDFVSAITTCKNSVLFITTWGVKQKPCLERIFYPPPSKIKWLNERCLLWNQQPIRNKNKRWLVENKNGGRKAFVDLWATIKVLKQQVFQLKPDF